MSTLSYLLSRELVAEVVSDLEAVIMVYVRRNDAKGGHLAVGSLDGEFFDWFEVGSPDPITFTIARSKLEVTLEHQKPTDQVPLAARRKGQTIFSGSDYEPEFRFGVAFSGASEVDDKLISQQARHRIAPRLAALQADLEEDIQERRARGEKIRFLGDEMAQ
ncbi:hypothetical protein HY346_00295 [Candidatus Microgenomates bacterium]|nr:hypothetical protein [Candidatus Microgenomates bacterium]